MNAVSVDEKLCQGCGECVRECPNQLSVRSGKHVDHMQALCTGCLHCYAVSRHGAVQVVGTHAIDEAGGNEHAINADALEGFLAFRRSVRRFRDEAVPPNVVARIVRAAQYVPSDGNRHAYSLAYGPKPSQKGPPWPGCVSPRSSRQRCNS